MSQNESHGNDSSKVDVGRKMGVLRKLSLLFLAALFLFSTGFGYLYFYFPKDRAKKTILAQLQKTFHITLRFSGLNFNPFNGLELTDVSLRGAGDVEMPVVKLDRIVFKMEFWDLFLGKVTIKRAIVDKPLVFFERRGGVWNFERMLEGFNKKSQARTSSPAPAEETAHDKDAGNDSEASSSFALPMEINLEEFSLSHLSVSCIDEGKMQASISNLNANCKLELGKGGTSASAMLSVSPVNDAAKNISFLLLEPSKVILSSGFYVDLSLKTLNLNKLLLSGKLSLGNGTIEFDKRKDTIQLSSAINATIDLASGDVLLQSLDISSENIIWLKVNGEAKNILRSPSFVLNVEGASVLESAFRKFREILPLKRAAGSILLTGARLEGQLGKNVSFKGNVTASDLSVESDVLNMSGTKVAVNILNGKLSGKKLQSLDARIEQKTESIEFAGIKIKDKTEPLRIDELKQTANIKIRNGGAVQFSYEILAKGGSVGSSGMLSALELSIDSKTSGNQQLKPEEISGKLSMRCGDMSYQPFALHGAASTFSFGLGGGDIKKIAADIDVNIEGVTYTTPDIGDISLPLKLKASFIANAVREKQKKNYTLLDIPTIKSHIDAGAIIAELNASKNANDDFSLLLSVKSDFKKMLLFIPPAMSEKIGTVTARGSLVSDTKITGKLDKDYKNTILNISEDLQIVGLSCELPKKKVFLKPSEIYLHVLSDYRLGNKNASSAKVRGDISIGAASLPTLSVSSLQTSFQANTEGTIYKTSSRINGNIIALRFLPHQAFVESEKRQTKFTDTVNLSFGLKTRQDIENATFVMERLKVEIPSLLLLKTKNSVGKISECPGTDASLSIESMDALYSILPEWFRQNMPITRPEGKLDVSIKTSGRKPCVPVYASTSSGINNSSVESEVKLEFSGLDINSFMLDKNKVEGGAKITGIAVLTLGDYGENNGELGDIYLLDMDVTITDIGQKTLEKMLSFLDPTEENQGVANAGRYLKYEEPSSLFIKFQNGSLTLSLQMKSKILPEKKITVDIFHEMPVSELKNFAVFKENLKRDKNVLNVLKVLFAKK